jgi:hypothetical protein
MNPDQQMLPKGDILMHWMVKENKDLAHNGLKSRRA